MITEINKGSVVTTTMIAEARKLALGVIARKEKEPVPLSGPETMLLAEVIGALTQSEASDPHDLEGDSLMGSFPPGLDYLTKVASICDDDAVKILVADKAYGGSWQKRGGTGAFHMLARKWDRLETRVSKFGFDIFEGIRNDKRREGLIDDIRDLRRYLVLVEAVSLLRGYTLPEGATKESEP